MEKAEDKSYWTKRPLNDDRRDWNEKGKNWVDDYKVSVNHPHRKLILNELKEIGEFDSLLEVGCNAGPNLKVISEAYPQVRLAGIDVNADSINEARSFVNADLKVAEATEIPFEDDSFDVVLCDAVLIYLDPDSFRLAMSEINRIARKGVIFVEWDDKSEEGRVVDGHWARDYENILFDWFFNRVGKTKIKPEDWPNRSGNWARNGYVFIGMR